MLGNLSFGPGVYQRMTKENSLPRPPAIELVEMKENSYSVPRQAQEPRLRSLSLSKDDVGKFAPKTSGH